MLMFLEEGYGRHIQTRRNEDRYILQDSTKRQYLTTKLNGVVSHKTAIVRTDGFVAHVHSKAANTAVCNIWSCWLTLQATVIC